MDPTTEKTQPMEYHIQIAGIDPLQDNRCDRQIIDEFLATLFDPKGSGLEDSPLQYKKHEYSVEDSAISSSSVLRVEFRLTDDAEKSGITLAEAAERLCQHILDPRAESSLKTLTPFGLLGISALSDPFKRCWTQACFGDYAVNGPGLLKRVDTEFNNYLPQWALALSFAVVIGADFGIFCNVKDESPCTTDISINDAITIGSSILEKYTRNLKPDARKQEVWNTKLATNLRTVVTKLEEVTSLESINLSNNGDRPNPSDDLCNALYEATLADAKIATSNKEYLKEFLSFSKLAGANAVGAGLAAAGKTAFAAGGASWGLAEVTTGFTASQAPAAFSSVLSAAGPVVLGAAAVCAAWWIFHGRRRFMRRQYHNTEDALMRCYRLMNETFSLLRCIELTDSGPFQLQNRPLSLRFINDYGRAMCTDFMRNVRMRNYVGQDVEPRMVLNYLGEQLTEMRNLVNAMDGLLEE